MGLVVGVAQARVQVQGLGLARDLAQALVLLLRLLLHLQSQALLELALKLVPMQDLVLDIGPGQAPLEQVHMLGQDHILVIMESEIMHVNYTCAWDRVGKKEYGSSLVHHRHVVMSR